MLKDNIHPLIYKAIVTFYYQAKDLQKYTKYVRPDFSLWKIMTNDTILTCCLILNTPPASSIRSLILPKAPLNFARPSALSKVCVVITYKGGAIKLI